MLELFHQTAFGSSKLITSAYSTSFTIGIKTLNKKFHNPIYAIYGYVRYADEIVDTFHDFDKHKLLRDFRQDSYKALEEGISLNPVLHAFQLTVKQYEIDVQLINAFLDSMETDLTKSYYHDKQQFNEYIYGSAEVVGLMCLKVFCEGDKEMFEKLKAPAKSLGAAFQKVNFLRDMQDDFLERGRVYFPGIEFHEFNNHTKKIIENDIQADFDHAYTGILQLPDGARLGVYLAYVYYLSLFKKIKQSTAEIVKQQRIRVSDKRKISLLVSTYLRNSLNLI